MADHRDAVITELATSEAALREDVVIYRELSKVALEEVHALTHTLKREREQHRHVLDEYRKLRAEIRHRVAA